MKKAGKTGLKVFYQSPGFSISLYYFPQVSARITIMAMKTKARKSVPCTFSS
jgi:hypothetical protein